MSRVRTQSRALQANLAVQEKAGRHLKRRAELLSGIAKNLHRTAPRGGENVNRFGERRSAPGQVPAMETGSLFAAIDQGVTVLGLEATVLVNWAEVEFQTRNVAPRPLGEIALREFRTRVA